MTKKVIIDTDPGDDDAAAILWCLASDKIQVEALTITHGNVEVEKCANNALVLLGIAGRQDIPVYIGANTPLLRQPWHSRWIHGGDGFGNVNFPAPETKLAGNLAAEEIVRRAKESPGELTLLVLGPLTNIALAIGIEPRLVEWIKEIVLMGGAVRTAGNVTPVATFNIVVDPEAAYIVYHSGIPIVQVGLDVCNHVEETDQDLATVEEMQSPVTDFLIKLLQFRTARTARLIDEVGEIYRVPGMANIDAPNHVTGKGIRLNDLPAAGYLVAPELFHGEQVYVEIETKGEFTSGVTIADFRGQYEKPSNAKVLTKVEGRALVKRWINDIINYQT
jgi:inosine-uridine nucleoside N-ribohydrolase